MCWASALRSWPSAGIWVIQRESSHCNLSTRITGGGKPFNGLIIQNLIYRVHAYSVAILAPAISSWHWFMMSLVLGSAWILSLVRTWWLLFAQPAPTPPCWCCWHQQGILSSVSAAISACSKICVHVRVLVLYLDSLKIASSWPHCGWQSESKFGSLQLYLNFCHFCV